MSSFAIEHPATVVASWRHLDWDMVREIGGAMAKRLLERFGLQTLEVIETTPERLIEVYGIRPSCSEKGREAGQQQREMKDVMLALLSERVSTVHAGGIYKGFGRRAIADVRGDP